MKNVKNIIELIEVTSSTKQKENILKEHKNNELLQKVLFYTYNQDMKYKVSEKMLNAIEEGSYRDQTLTNLNIFELLDTLSENNINDNLRYLIGSFYNSNEHMWEFYKKILLKDLRCNISEKTVNKVWKGLIPTHDVMLASKFEGVLDEKKGRVAVTTKMDGLRVSAIVDKTNNKVVWKTRQGKEIEGLNILSASILKMTLCDCFIDGELLAFNDEELTSGELFRKTTKIANSKSNDKRGLSFVMFDYLSIEEYKNKKCITPYCERIVELKGLSDNYNKYLGEESVVLKIVEHHTITNDVNEIYEILTKVCAEGEEGLILNYMQGMYEFKRSKNILKVKEFFTVDLRVTNVEEGTGRNKGRLGALVVDYKGNEVRVGSGFTDDERDSIWRDRNQQNTTIIGRIVEVKYFEESKNEKGELSLRFPTFVHIRNDKTEPSYN